MNFTIKGPGRKIFEIHVVGEGTLRKNAKFVTIFDENLREFVGDMFATMYAADGIGLAAPQVGKSLRVVVMDVSSSLSEGEMCKFDGQEVQDIASIMPLHLINPVIKKYSSEICSQKEGCLSIPGFSGHVKRPREVMLIFVDQKNASHTLTCDGILARCAQHEIDHLNGKLYTDLMSHQDKKRFAKYLAERSEMQSSERDDGDSGAPDNLQS